MPTNSAKNVRAGGAYVEFFAKDGALQASLRNIGKQLNSFGKAMKTAGTETLSAGMAAVAPVVAAVGTFVKSGDDVAKAANRTGIAAEAISSLKYAADQSGTSLETLVKGTIKMQQHLVDAAAGSDSAREAFESLGLNIEALSSMSPDEQFRTIADRLSRIEDPAQRSAKALDLFGKAGVEMLPLINAGGDGIAGLEQRARDLGLVINSADASQAEELGDIFDDLWKVVSGAAFKGGAALAPLLKDLAVAAIGGVQALSKWIDSNRDVIVTIAKVAVGVVAAGAAMIVIGKIIAVVGTLVTGLAATWGVMSTVLGVILSPVATLTTVVGALGMVLGAVFSPLGLVVGAIAGLVYWSGAGSDALAWLREQFGPLGSIASETMTAIHQALTSGNTQGAANVLWAGLRLAWVQGSQALQATWRALMDGVSETWHGTIDVLSQVFVGWIANVERNWIALRAALVKGAIEAKRLLGQIGDAEARAMTGFVDVGAAASHNVIDNREREAKAIIDADGERRREAAMADESEQLKKTAEALKLAQEEFAAALQEVRDAKPSNELTLPNGQRLKVPSTVPDATAGGTAYDSKGNLPNGTFSALASRIFGAGTSQQTAQKHLAVAEKQTGIQIKIHDEIAGLQSTSVWGG